MATVVPGELSQFGKMWWSQGSGAAMLFILMVVIYFRTPEDIVFWVALVGFVVNIVAWVWQCARLHRDMNVSHKTMTAK